ncbi:MAG: hypothetical protein GXO32_08885 [Crenarchaeota archaeon]|nr:hypothetical protein [Thermoproteota archaeon]
MVPLPSGKVRRFSRRYDEKFREYLLKDRGLSEETARDYMNCLRELDGKAMNYDLMSREIPCSR